MVVHHSSRLHERIADGRTDEGESALLEIFTHRVGFGGASRNSLRGLPDVDARFASDELLDVTVEGLEFFLDCEECLRVLYGCCDLQTVADDSGILHQGLHLSTIVAGNFLRVETTEGSAVVLALP